MATAITPEHVETPTAPVAEKPSQVEVRKVAIDGNTLSVLAVGVGLFALAFGAFTHLRERIDNVATELRTDIKAVDAKLSGEIKSLDAKIEQLATRTDDKFEKINARLDRLFELVASQGRERP